jgi:hypothetical protein
MIAKRVRRFPMETTHAGYVLVILIIFTILALGIYEAFAAYVNPRASIFFAATTSSAEPLPDRWLTMQQPTQVYTPEDQEAWVAQPGEVYQVILEQDGWVLVVREGEPPANLMWMHLDPWVSVTDGHPQPEPDASSPAT